MKEAESGVSPVVGVILVVAMTVVLAATVGVFVLDFAPSATSSQPQAGISIAEDTSSETVSIQVLSMDRVDSVRVDYADGSKTLTQVGEQVTVPSTGGDVSVIGVLDKRETVLDIHRPRQVDSGSSEGVLTPDLIVAPDGSGDYTSLQAGIDASTDGDVLLLKSGTYTEAPIVSKSITLTGGEEVAVISGNNEGTGLIIGPQAEPHITNIEFANYRYGIDSSDAEGDWSAESVTFTNNDAGLYAFKMSGNWTGTDITATGQKYSGLNLNKAQGTWTVTSSEFSDNGNGIYGAGSAGWVVQDSTFTDNERGITSTASSGYLITENTFSGDGVAVSARNSYPGTIRHNSFERKYSGSYSVDAYSSNGVDVRYNWWGASDVNVASQINANNEVEAYSPYCADPECDSTMTSP